MRVAKLAIKLILMKSQTQQSSQPQRPRLIRRAPAPILPLRTSPPLQPPAQRPRLIRRAPPAVLPPSPRTSPQLEQSDGEDGEEEFDDEDNQEEEHLGQKRKQGCNSLRDALMEEVGKKKRKRGIGK
jgi:hypothetical protein